MGILLSYKITIFQIESWLKKHGERDQHRPWQGKNRHYGGLSYFPDNDGNENKESKVENEKGKEVMY